MFDPEKFAKQSRADFASNVTKVYGWVQEVGDLHAAQAANNETHKVTTDYSSPNYLPYTARSEAWKAVDRVLESRFEALNDENYDLDWKLFVVLHALPPEGRRAIIEIVDKCLPLDQA